MAKDKSDFHSALIRLSDDDLTDDERELLLAEMIADPASRKEFLEHQMLAAALEERFAIDSAADNQKARALPGIVPTNGGTKVIQFPRPAWLWSAVAAVFIAGFALSRLISPSSAPDSVETVLSEPTPEFVLTRAIDVQWAKAARLKPQIGQPIEETDLRIDSGIIEIQFSSGAAVTIEGPARLKLNSDMECRLVHGKLAANCPPSAHGFVVKFPKGKVLDLGTEFALDASPGGKTDVHVLDGEVIVARTDVDEQVLSEKNLFGNSAVAVDDEIEEITYDAGPFAGLKRESLVQSQPLKLQFDLGHRAGLYVGTNAPAHAAGDMFEHENHWTQIVGDQSGAFVMADGNVCPHVIKVDYGHGDGEIDWDATPVDPWGKVDPKAKGVFNTALTQDHRPWDYDLGIRIGGLPAGTYRIYALCRSARRIGASYDVSFGVNLSRQVEAPIIIPPMDPNSVPEWIEGVTYEAEDVEISGPEDWATFITRYSRERSVQKVQHGRSVLLGLQIVEIR